MGCTEPGWQPVAQSPVTSGHRAVTEQVAHVHQLLGPRCPLPATQVGKCPKGQVCVDFKGVIKKKEYKSVVNDLC